MIGADMNKVEGREEDSKWHLQVATGTSGACPISRLKGKLLPPCSKYLIPIETVKTKAGTKLGCSSVMDYINFVPYTNNLTQEAAPFMPGTKSSN